MLAQRRRRATMPFEVLEDRSLLTGMLALSGLQDIVPANDGYTMEDFGAIDINNDNLQDLVVLQRTGSRQDGSSLVGVYLQTEEADFKLAAEATFDISADVLILTPKDSDGFVEFGVKFGYGDMRVSGFRWDDGVEFVDAKSVRTPAGDIASTTQLLDLNQDGRADLIRTQSNGVGGHVVTVSHAQGDGSWGESVTYPGTLWNAADFNANGLNDLVIFSPNGSMRVLLNDGAGFFDEVSFETAIGPSGTVVINTLDANDDGAKDLLAIDALGVFLFYANGDGTFANRIMLQRTRDDTLGGPGTIGYEGGVHVVDIDGDGRDDIFLGTEWVPHGGTYPARILYRTEEGFEALPLGASWPVGRPVDLLGDSKAEFVRIEPQGLSVSWQVQPRSLDVEILNRPNLARRVVDVTGDGHGDIVLATDTQLTILDTSTQERMVVDIALGTRIGQVHAMVPLEENEGTGVTLFVSTATPASSDPTAEFTIQIRKTDLEWTAELQPLPEATVDCRHTIPSSCIEERFSPRDERDLNGDGITERVIYTPDVGYEIYQQQDLVWSPVAPTPIAPEFELGGIEDFDGDGILDLLYRASCYARVIRGVSFGNGNLLYGPVHQVIGRAAYQGLLVDLDGESLAVSTAWREANPHGDLTSPNPDERLVTETIMLGAADTRAVSHFLDVNADGHMDVVALSAQGVTFVTRRNPGAFNDPQTPGQQDLDLLFAHIGDRDANAIRRFDLNNDYRVDQRDVDFWLTQLANTRRGDSNLDGRVDFADFLTISQHFGKEDATWSHGDSNEDGLVDFVDFLQLAANFGFDNEESLGS